MKYKWNLSHDAAIGVYFYLLSCRHNGKSSHVASIQRIGNDLYRTFGPKSATSKAFERLEDAQAYLLGVVRFT